MRTNHRSSLHGQFGVGAGLVARLDAVRPAEPTMSRGSRDTELALFAARGHPSERGAHVAIADRHQAAVSAWPSPISRVLPQRTYRNRQKAGPLSRTSR